MIYEILYEVIYDIENYESQYEPNMARYKSIKAKYTRRAFDDCRV